MAITKKFMTTDVFFKEDFKMNRIVLLLLTNILLGQSISFACELSIGGILPNNTMSIPIGNKAATGLDQEDFTYLIDKVASIYAPVIAERGGELDMAGEWVNPTVNAYATRIDQKYVVRVSGGIARHPFMTPDTLVMVLCHELGHHIGGAPVKSYFFGNTKERPTNEGQSDYFASLKCFKKIFAYEDNYRVMKTKTVSNVLKSKCTESYGQNSSEYFLCLRSGVAGYNLARILNASNSEVSFDIKDQKVVPTTYDGHPQAQCRLDTYLAGSLCDRVGAVDKADEQAGACNRVEADMIGIRPLCWYKPTSSSDNLLATSSL